MAAVTFSKRNLNRYKKVYPYIQKTPIEALASNKAVMIEVGTITFTSASTGTFNFVSKFPDVPIVTGITLDTLGTDVANVNLYISAVTATAVTIKSSASFTGRVHVHAMYIPE